MRASRRPHLPWKQIGIRVWPSAGRVFPLPNQKVILEGPMGGASMLKELSHAQWDSNHGRLITVDAAPVSTFNMDRN